MLLSAALLEELAVLWFQAPLVISSRMQDMATSGGSGGTVEMNLMMTEKLSAAVESVMAVNVAMIKESVIAVAAIATGTCSGMAGGADRVAVAALTPYGNRVRANAERLSK